MSPTVRCSSYSVYGTGVASCCIPFFKVCLQNFLWMPGVPRCSHPLETVFFSAKVTKGVGQTFAQHGAQKKSQQPAGLWKLVDREYLAAWEACYWMGGESVGFVEMISSLFLVGWWASQLVVTCHGRALLPFLARLQYLWTIPSSAHLS